MLKPPKIRKDKDLAYWAGWLVGALLVASIILGLAVVLAWLVHQLMGLI